MPKIVNPITIVKTGGSPAPVPQPLDPEQVYRDTRPSDWLVMPEPQENEIYFLLQIDKDTIDDQVIAQRTQQSSGSITTLEVGTVTSSGVFVPDPTYTATKTSVGLGYIKTTVPASVYGNTTSTGQKQLMGKISATGSLLECFCSGDPSTMRTAAQTMEISSNAPLTYNSYNASSPPQYSSIRYASFKGYSSTHGTYMFNGCSKLICVRALDSSEITSFSRMFQNCYSLTAIPQLDTGSGTAFNYMFSGCHSLTTIPQLDTSSGTNFNNMFSSCNSLITIPQLDTTSGTDFSSMFASCSSLKAIPQLDTPSGTNFNTMFSYLFSLTRADLRDWDLSSASNISNLFNNAPGGVTLDFGDKWPQNGIPGTSAIVGANNSFIGADTPLKIRIHKTDAMLPISANATTLFSSSQYVYVYVPDALLATYQADAYWATLGTRLKAMSEWTA